MRNVDLFNEFTLLLLDNLYDSFPVPMMVDKEKFLGKVLNYPVLPFIEKFGVPGSGIYIGPDFEWVFDSSDRYQLWHEFDWNSCIKDVEILLHRKMKLEEKNILKETGIRPYTNNELNQLNNWRKLLKSFKEDEDQRNIKEIIFISSIQFLVNEGFIRFLDLPGKVNLTLNPTDVLIQKALKQLRFVLTKKGFSQLNKSTPLEMNGKRKSLFKQIQNYVADKSLDAVATTGAGSIIAFLFS